MSNPQAAAAWLGAVNEDSVQVVRAEQERLLQVIHDLRNPVGSVSMAIELLRGPFASILELADRETRERVRVTLDALHESAKQLRYLVSDASYAHAQAGGPGANEAPAPSAASTHSPLAPAGPAATAPTLVATASEREAPSVTKANRSLARAATARPGQVKLGELVRRLEILTVTRSSLPALLAVNVEADLTVWANGAELLRALSNLVENAIEASAQAFPGRGPWTVEIHAYRRGTQAAIEICNRGVGLPASVLAWLRAPAPGLSHPPSSKTDGGLHGLGLSGARKIAQACSGSLEAECRGDMTIIRLLLPVPAPRKGTATPVHESDI